MCTKTTAIDKDTPPSVPPSVPPITDYIISAAVTNKRGAQVVIDHTSKIIKVSLFKNSAKSDVSISLTLAKGVSLVYPNQSEFRYDLNHEASIWVDYNNAQVKYNVIYEDKNSPEVDPTTLGWTKVSTFGSLPEGFDVYKSPDKLSGKTAIAYLVVADLYKNRKFHTLGEESISDGKTLSQFYNETQYPVIMNGGYFFYSSYI